jgi:ABC-type nickel/cobalt efflux system permease component RcnA
VAPLLPIRDAAGPSAPPPANRERQALESATLPPPAASVSPAAAPAETPAPAERPLRLEPNSRATPRDAFTALIATPEISASILVLAALLAAALGAFHALEPGHGKTVVAAYLVGSRGTARHALLLGLIVTASHTAGVYLLGGVTLYASRYIVPEQLYPWLGAVSGLIIAALGFALFLRRYAGRDEPHGHAHHADDHAHDHAHGHAHAHHHDHGHRHADAHGHGHGHGHHHHVPTGQTVSLRALFALGITGGIVPCPAALVVLLSAVALRRVGFGLFLIAAFSVGLAAVLIAIGLLMVYARRLMARFQGEGRVVTRWLPLTSSAVMTVLGLAIAGQALMAAGILQLRLG